MSNVTPFKSSSTGPSVAIAYETLVRLQELEFIDDSDAPKDHGYASDEDQVLSITEFHSGKRLIEVTPLP